MKKPRIKYYGGNWIVVWSFEALGEHKLAYVRLIQAAWRWCDEQNIKEAHRRGLLLRS